MFLASKLRAAASRGELDRLVIDPALAGAQGRVRARCRRASPRDRDRSSSGAPSELRGKRVFMIGAYNLMYELAQERPRARREERLRPRLGDPHRRRPEGVRAARELHGRHPGVPRRRRDPGGLRHVRASSAFHWACRREALPRAALGDPATCSTRTPASRCRATGVHDRARRLLRLRSTAATGAGSSPGTRSRSTGARPAPAAWPACAFAHDIIRYSEKQGVEDDRISCSATQEVNNEALAFMKAFES